MNRRAANRELKDRLWRIVFIIVLIGCTMIFFTPFVWLVSASLKVRAEVFNSEWIPDPVAWENYVRVWQVAPVFTWLKNSLVIGILAAVSVTISCAAIAFGFSYFRFRGRDTLFGLVLATMMLPGVVTMIPVFLVWQRLGFVNTQVPLWAGNLFGSAFYIFLLRQFYLGLPRELFEAARVDGASYFQMWRNIALPLTRTALIVVFIFEFKASWTDLLKPLIYLQNSALFTLPRGLKAILDQFGQGGEMQWEIVLAASVIVTVPMLVIFFLGQRYFMDGIATTGLKG
ncbi:MAG: carbohydrate ABC transporter permease [Chloroflexi bacterium]|nr:carbohydrate ABC transporter permease [Chloroflexota bacterium]